MVMIMLHLQICSRLLKKHVNENFIFCAEVMLYVNARVTLLQLQENFSISGLVSGIQNV